MKEKFLIKQPLYLIFSVVFISGVLMLLLYGTIKIEQSIEKKMIEISTNDVFTIVNNSVIQIEELLDKEQDYSSQILSNEILQKAIEKKLELLITENIAYTYLLYKDERGVFRFLADGSKKDKAFVNQKFDIDNLQWLDVYKTKESLQIENSYLQELSITHIAPVFRKGKVEMLLTVDFSIKKVRKINQILTMMKNGIITIVIIIILFLAILLFQTLRYLKMRKNAYVDKLTGVYNRNYLQDAQDFIHLQDYILATLDIDHFKAVNDTYGHDVGDKILTQVAECIRGSMRKHQDIAIRYGGEEFVLLIKRDPKETLEEINIVEYIFKAIQTKDFWIQKKESLAITVSIGVNLAPHQSRTFSEAFKLADIALFNAKSRGRNNIEIYDENNHNNNSTMMSINEIKEAIEENRLLCYYQKIVSNETLESSHYEALLRIRDKQGNIITPDRILPAIEGTFLLRNITKAVLEICYEKLLVDPDISINVNLNPTDIINPSIIEILTEYAQQEGIAKRLGLEIVETQDVVRTADGKENLLTLKKLGYKIYIDDFGSGYSNFIYLAQIQTDFIKIDGAIIKKILDDKISYLLVKSVVGFAKEAGIQVIAEFVSSEEIYQKVKELGIEYSQGYHFSIPSEL
ncbi:MAG: EAL domain-containing protein [Helicobacteraceae bacterium]|nr:EAL domain-containing protein [Helicobacteraceae bacterium]